MSIRVWAGLAAFAMMGQALAAPMIVAPDEEKKTFGKKAEATPDCVPLGASSSLSSGASDMSLGVVSDSGAQGELAGHVLAGVDGGASAATAGSSISLPSSVGQTGCAPVSSASALPEKASMVDGPSDDQ